MRFHIGFSKFIKPKTLIEILGLLFLGSLAFFGIYQHEVLAWTDYDYSNFSFIQINEYNRDNNYNTINRTPYLCHNTSSSSLHYYRPRVGTNSTSSSCSGNAFVFATTQGTNSLYLLDDMTFKINQNNFCDTSSSDNLSINFRWSFRVGGDSSVINYGHYFNVSSTYPNYFTETIGVRMVAVDDNNGDSNYYVTNCSVAPMNTLDNGVTYGSHDLMATCTNVFRGSSRYPVDYYFLQIFNVIPFNNIYNSTLDTGSVEYSFSFYEPMTSTNKETYPVKYECSNEPPNSGGDWPGDDENGLNDVWEDIKNSFDSSITGIDTSEMIVNLPATFTDLLTMPLDIVRAIVNNSTSSTTCSNYNIDLSSIVRKWGNPNSTYVLSLPCMRSVLSNKLGTIYTLIDSLLAFYLKHFSYMVKIKHKLS